MNIVCIPPLGADASFFAHWLREARSLDSIAVQAIHLPGRGSRLLERPISSMSDLADAIAEAMCDYADQDYIILGCSMGGWVGYELCKRLAAISTNRPQQLIVCGSTAPGNCPTLPSFVPEGDEELVQSLSAFGASFRIVAANAELLSLVLPAWRADLTLCVDWQADFARPLDIPIKAVAGEDDDVAPASLSRPWEKCTDKSFTIERVPGGHLFIQDLSIQEILHLAGVKNADQPLLDLRTLRGRGDDAIDKLSDQGIGYAGSENSSL
nr:alpha/beta fold hydrolase [Rhizobium changzhiense]